MNNNRDSTHDFVVVIPVADRPHQLRLCLDSLLALIQRFPYPGNIRVLIADDSAQGAHRAKHQALACAFTQAGLACIHFDHPAQQALLERYAVQLPGLIDAQRVAQLGHFGHKGQGVMRNLAYLYLLQSGQGSSKNPLLIWSVDSDQEFRENPEKQDSGIAYFHAIDRIFQQTHTLVLTGKIVGDPPVSPAVMASGLLRDVIALLAHWRLQNPQQACTLHNAQTVAPPAAAYHDMGTRFGFTPPPVCAYDCPLPTPHTVTRSFGHFASRLDGFWDGEHPTRAIPYQRTDIMASITPARTVYAGNYVFSRKALAGFIPFAPLRLRMSGPTLGRLLQRALGDRFVSANIPLLHWRTPPERLYQSATTASECRPGVTRQAQIIDISDEFIRQFYGDVTLFTMERLTSSDLGRPCVDIFNSAGIGAAWDQAYSDLQADYNQRRQALTTQLDQMASILFEPGAWWSDQADAATTLALSHFQSFVDNMRANFAPQGRAHQAINDPTQRDHWRKRILDAFQSYPAQHAHWEAVFLGKA
jgi:hypothetical protein